MVDSPTENINIQLGDIVELIAPDSEQLNLQEFYVDYIDPSKISLINIETSQPIQLDIEDGKLVNDSILQINLLSRAESPSYARQNNLVPGIWIDIFIKTDDGPLKLTGQIMSLEEDSIEVKTYPDGDNIYLDFAYQGLPKEPPIDSIVIRDDPTIEPEKSQAPEISEKPDLSQSSETPSSSATSSSDTTPDMIQEQIQQAFIEGNQIELGEDLEEIEQLVDVPDSERRYTIERQTDDLLDKLLSTIPSSKRTNAVLNNIHTMIQRYTQLRKAYSKMDRNGNANMPDPIEEHHKPLLKSVANFDKNLAWLLPVSFNRKKLYDIEGGITAETGSTSIIDVQLGESLADEENDIELYRTGRFGIDENNYTTLFKKLNEYFTPFTPPIEQDNSIISKRVAANILSVVNNLDDMFSIVAGETEKLLNKKKFLLEMYNLGLTYPQDKNLENLTPADIITIKSILVLTIPELLFSRLSLPTTKILTKTELDKAHLLYWQILTKNTEIEQTLTIDSLQSSDKSSSKQETGYETDASDYDRPEKFRKTLFSRTRQYILDETLYGDTSDTNVYEQFLDQIIPTNEECFNILKKFIVNPLSVHSIVQFLEVFNIYHKDLTANLYSKIINFVRYNIASYKTSLAKNISSYSKLSVKKTVPLTPSQWLKILSTHKALNTIVLDAYDLQKDVIYSDTEILTRIFSVDYGRLFSIALVRINLDLQSTGLIKEFVDKYEENLRARRTLDNTCKTITKRYTSMESLIADNKPEIYVDAEFDQTDYPFIDKYKAEQESQTPEQFKDFLQTKLLEIKDLTPDNAEREANAILLKKRAVEDGDYALLVTTDDSDKTTEYFVRKDNTWVKDADLVGNVEIKDNKLFCNLQEDCILDDGKCKTLKQREATIDEETLKAIYKEFDETYGDREANIRESIDKILEQSIMRIRLLRRLKTAEFYKYDKLKQTIADLLENPTDVLESSPYENIRDLILSQGDFVKKQNYIQRFTMLFTRKPYSDEDQYWLYCIKTNVKLLPTFLSHLANVFISGGNYIYELDVVATNQGTMSDDGDAWVDKYSGYFIKKIEFDTEEGYTEEGFKLKTREKLEQDLGDAVLELSIAPKPSGEVESAESIIISNIIDAITGNSGMGIDIDSDRAFIINNVLLLQKKAAPTMKQYTARTAKLEKEGKKVTSYEDEVGRPLIILTFIFIAIAIQTNIPGIDVNKTFPTCIKSFEGYPVFGDDLSALTYIACIARKMRSNEYPWSSIKQLKEEKIISLMKTTIDTFKIMSNASVKLKIDEKRIFNKTRKKDKKIDREYLDKLQGFLPPLIPFTVKAFPLEAGFGDLLARNIVSGSYLQHEQISIIKSKMLKFSLSIQESIQKIVSKEDPLITTKSAQPFLENSCCNSKSTNVHRYFTDIDGSIITNNDIVSSLDNIIYDIYNASTAPLFYNPTDTKYKYPDIDDNFSADTIYRAFIVFCKHKQLALSDELRETCGLPSTLPFIEETTEQRIEQLKEDGINYDEQLLQKLLTIVNTKNEVHIDLSIDTPNSVQLFSNKLTEMSEIPEKQVIPSYLINKLLELIDTYTLKQDTATQSRGLKNYLDAENSRLNDEIKLFIQTNTGLSKTKFANFVSCLDNITEFLEIGDDVYVSKKDETVFKMMFFVRNTLHNLINVFPNIVVNKVNYTNVSIPSHWNLSLRHITDLKEIIGLYYKNLRQFYSLPDLDSILVNIQSRCKSIEELALVTPYFASFSDGKDIIDSVFDEQLVTLLFKYYLLTTVHEYINLTQLPQHFATPQEVLAIGETSPTKDDEDESSKKESPLEEESAASYIAQATIAGAKKEIMNNVSSYLINVLEMVCNDKATINYNKETIMSKILVAKEKEKDKITEFLGNLSDEEREVENLFKQHKLEKWSKGLQKGLTQYVQENYDEEREELDKQRIKDRELAKRTGVTNQNSNIYSDDMDEEARLNDEIEKEEYSLEGFGGEDDNPEEEDDYL